MILLLIQLCISWCTYIMYNIKIIYAYKIRFSQQNMHTITVNFPHEHLTSVDNVQQFVIVVQKFVCITFCRVIS